MVYNDLLLLLTRRIIYRGFLYKITLSCGYSDLLLILTRESFSLTYITKKARHIKFNQFRPLHPGLEELEEHFWDVDAI